MRKILVLLSILLVVTLVLSGCGFSSWQDEETAREIKSINRIVDTATGEVFLQVVYSDDTTSDKFSLPAGVSVTGVKSSYNSTERKTTVTFEFSDGKTQQSFTIPDGKDGTRVIDVAINPDGSGTPYLYFYFSDGTQSDGVDISVLKGENGVDGIDGVDGKDGSVWLFGDGVPADDPDSEEEGQEVEKLGKDGDCYLDTRSYAIYLKKGGKWEKQGSLKGTGIKDMGYFDGGIQIIYTDFDDEGNLTTDSLKIYSSAIKGMSVEYDKASGMYNFSVTVTQVDGTEKVLENVASMQRPATWFYGSTYPVDGAGALANVTTFDGDFYYATNQSEIFIKENGVWKRVITLEPSDQESCTITFYPEGGVMSADINDYPMQDGDVRINKKDDGQVTSVEVSLKKGQCYPSSSFIPMPTRDGYTFKGWYKTKEISSVNAAFTDMIPVYEDITLYAVWEPNNA